jgi:GntR family transcriptional regulator, transcriptional repressor for pyruvate dehydrogenase complex
MEGLEQTAKLLELIRERGFHPGDKLPSERDLAALFGMSRSAVREALIRLDTLRIIESRPKSGVYLRPFAAERSIEAMVLFTETDTPLSEEDVVQSVELRSVLESEAMRLACLRRTQADLDRLKRILQDSAEAIARGETLADLDAEFHKAIVAATQNHVLLRFINVFYLMSRKRREVYFHDSEQSQRSHAQHLQLYRAIVAQDAELGQKILRRHLKGVDAYFRMFFAEGHRGANEVKPVPGTAKTAALPAKNQAASTGKSPSKATLKAIARP